MNIEEMEKLYLSRRSCRSYLPDKKVDADTLKRIVSLAMLAPSACNSQPWKVYAVCREDIVKQIAEATHKMGANKFTDDCTAFAVIAEARPNLTERMGQKITGNDFVANDIGIMCAHFVLAAEAAGVSSCILGMFDGDKIKKILGISDKIKIALVVALGYAKEEGASAKKRKPIQEVCEFIV